MKPKIFKSVDICSSAHNEEGIIDSFIETLLGTFNAAPQYEWRLVLVDNGSHDRTWEIISNYALRDSRVIGIKLSRNFGFDKAIMASLNESRSDVSIIMASDLQDDPAHFERFLDLYSQGFDHVYQIVTQRPSVTWVRRLLTSQFYRFGAYITDNRIIPNATDYRLISRRLRELLIQAPDQSRLNRAIVNYFSLPSVGIHIPRSLRISGESKSTSRYALSLGLRGIFSNSKRLLDYVGLMSLIFFLSTSFLLIVFSIFFVFVGVPFGGFGTIVGLILLLFSLNFLSLGIISQYLGIITELVQRRPQFVVDEVTSNVD
jgi:glycosyltransferase involved in cell wall biosynthesis